MSGYVRLISPRGFQESDVLAVKIVYMKHTCSTGTDLRNYIHLEKSFQKADEITNTK